MPFNLGDWRTTETIPVPFSTYDSAGGSATITGLAVTDIEIYKNGLVTQRASDNGYTLLDTDGIDFDTTTGIHGFSIDLSDNSDAGFYSDGDNFWIVINAITVDAQTVRFVYFFTIGKLLRPTTAGRTLDVTATGEAGMNLGNVTGVLGNANVGWVDANNRIDLGSILGTAVATPTVAGVLEVDVTHLGGVSQSLIDLKDFADAGYDPATNKVQGVVLVDTVTNNTDMRGTDNAFLATSAPANFADLSITVATGLVTLAPVTHTGAVIPTVSTNTDMRGTDNALLATSAPTNWSAMVITAGGAVDSLVQGYLNTLITETTLGRIAGNFDVFYENADAATTQTVDDVGGGGGGGGLTEQQTRDAMKLAPSAGDPADGSIDEHLDRVDQRTAVVQIPSPPLIGLLDLWLDASKGITLTGGEVSTWADQSGNSNDCTQTTAADRPTPLVDAAGRQAIAFGNSDTEVTFMDVPVGVSVDLANMSVFAVASFYGDVGQPNSVITFDSVNDNNGALGSHSANGSDPAFIFTSNGSGAIQRSTLKDQNNIAVMGYSSDATSVRFYDQTDTDSGTAMTGTATGGKVGSWNLIRGCRGTIYEILVYNRALTATESLAVVAYLKNRHGILDITQSIVFEGDSITEGFQSTHNRNYPFYTEMPGFRVHNGAFIGDGWVNIIADGSTLDTDYKIAGLTNTIVAMAGVNDILSGGATAIGAAANAEVWAAARKSAGWNHVGVMTVLAAATTALQETERLAYNDLLRDVAGNSWDFVVDLDDDPVMTTFGLTGNTIYWGNTNHPNSEGYRRVAKMVTRKILDYLAGTFAKGITARHVADRGVYMTLDNMLGKVWINDAFVPSNPEQWMGAAIYMTESPGDSGQYHGKFPTSVPLGKYLVTVYDRDLGNTPNPGDTKITQMLADWDGTSVVANPIMVNDEGRVLSTSSR